MDQIKDQVTQALLLLRQNNDYSAHHSRIDGLLERTNNLFDRDLDLGEAFVNAKQAANEVMGRVDNNTNAFEVMQRELYDLEFDMGYHTSNDRLHLTEAAYNHCDKFELFGNGFKGERVSIKLDKDQFMYNNTTGYYDWFWKAYPYTNIRWLEKGNVTSVKVALGDLSNNTVYNELFTSAVWGNAYIDVTVDDTPDTPDVPDVPTDPDIPTVCPHCGGEDVWWDEEKQQLTCHNPLCSDNVTDYDHCDIHNIFYTGSCPTCDHEGSDVI